MNKRDLVHKISLCADKIRRDIEKLETFLDYNIETAEEIDELLTDIRKALAQIFDAVAKLLESNS